MLRDRILSILKGSIEYELTGSQEHAVRVLTSYITSRNKDQILLLKGYAGTGKTTLIGGLVRTLGFLKLKSVLLAPTGRAAKVLSNYTGKPAYTIHKKIYRQKSSKDGFGEFLLEKNLHTNTYFIIDEASMISNTQGEMSVFGSGKLLDDLIEFVDSGVNCRLIITGDTAQLPPVGLDISPALDENTFSLYHKSVEEIELKDVVRQSAGSGILHNATLLRSNITGNKNLLPPFIISQFRDIELITGEYLVESISNCYDKYGLENTVVISRSNKRSNKYNQGIREQILWREEEISSGDYLMIVKNNYYWINDKKSGIDFIANGDIVEIMKIYSWEELYGYKFANVKLRFIDYDDFELETKILLDTLMRDSPSLPYEENRNFFNSVVEDYKDVKNSRERLSLIRENEHFNALQVKFAYAVTCHKAQGGQWKAVFIDQGYLTEEMINKEYLRWLYTAFTRGTEKLYLVNFSPAFFTFQ